MNKIILGLILVLFFCGISWADTDVESIGDLNTQTILDPCGYKNAKWGMTEEEVKKAISDIKWEDDWWIGKPAYKDTILDHNATVSFDFDKNKKLVQVHIDIKAKKLTDNFFDTRYNVTDLWTSVANILKEKYGEPESIYRNTTEMGPSVLNWMFLTTQITIKDWVFEYKGEKTKIGVNIIYYKREIKEGKKEDKEKF